MCRLVKILFNKVVPNYVLRYQKKFDKSLSSIHTNFDEESISSMLKTHLAKSFRTQKDVEAFRYFSRKCFVTICMGRTFREDMG